MHAWHCRPSNIVEGSLQYYKAQHPQEFVPQNLLRELLEDSNHSDELASQAGLLGNRVAAIWAGINDLIICSPTGSIGEILKLSTISQSDEERFQVLSLHLSITANHKSVLRPATWHLWSCHMIHLMKPPSRCIDTLQYMMWVAAVRRHCPGSMLRHAHLANLLQLPSC